MASDHHTYRLRPGRCADLPSATAIVCRAFHKDSLWDILFPKRHEQTDQFKIHVFRLFQNRYWSPEWFLTMVVDELGQPAGFTWWKRPQDEFSFIQRWLSPLTWYCAFRRMLLSLRDLLLPLRGFDQDSAGLYSRVFDKIKPEILNTPRRREAWYLSTLAVEPSLQGKGLGSMLVRDGQRKAQQRGKASWLVGLRGTDTFYNRLGFIEVARANVGDLSHWDGGCVMFTE